MSHFYILICGNTVEKEKKYKTIFFLEGTFFKLAFSQYVAIRKHKSSGSGGTPWHFHVHTKLACNYVEFWGFGEQRLPLLWQADDPWVLCGDQEVTRCHNSYFINLRYDNCYLIVLQHNGTVVLIPSDRQIKHRSYSISDWTIDLNKTRYTSCGLVRSWQITALDKNRGRTKIHSKKLGEYVSLVSGKRARLGITPGCGRWIFLGRKNIDHKVLWEGL